MPFFRFEALDPLHNQQQNTLHSHRWQLLRSEFLVLSRFIFILLRLLQIEDLPSIKTNQNLQESVFAKSAILGVKCILLPLVHQCIG